MAKSGIEEDDDRDDAADDAPSEPAAAAAPARPAADRGKRIQGILGLFAVTVVAVAIGGGFGMQIASHVEKIVADRAREKPAEQAPPEATKYAGGLVVQKLDPVIVNLAGPTDTWIRLETAIVFPKGALENPAVTSAEIRQDILAYARTVKLAQLEGPSALEHLREDLNDRVATRTGNRVRELVVETLIIQ